MPNNGTVKPLLSRFWEKVRRDPGGCWEWTGALVHGYGQLRLGRQGQGQIGVHQLSWLIHFPGCIPEGYAVCHECDNPRCVRPDHLWLGTQAQNLANMRAKGRASHQSVSPFSTSFRHAGHTSCVSVGP